MTRKLTLTFDLVVEVEARNEAIERGHWREPLSWRRENWITESVPPLTDTQLKREVRLRLNEMIVGTGVTASDFHFEATRVKGGRASRG